MWHKRNSFMSLKNNVVIAMVSAVSNSTMSVNSQWSLKLGLYLVRFYKYFIKIFWQYFKSI